MGKKRKKSRGCRIWGWEKKEKWLVYLFHHDFVPQDCQSCHSLWKAFLPCRLLWFVSTDNLQWGAIQSWMTSGRMPQWFSTSSTPAASAYEQKLLLLTKQKRPFRTEQYLFCYKSIIKAVNMFKLKLGGFYIKSAFVFLFLLSSNAFLHESLTAVVWTKAS